MRIIIRPFLEPKSQGHQVLRLDVALKAALRLSAGAGLVLLAACGEAEAPAGPPSATSTSTAATTPAPGVDDGGETSGPWLSRGDETPPAAWLAARSDPPGDPARLAALLGAADARFDETPRMLANRTVQLQAMLAGIAIQETPAALLEGFVHLGTGPAHIGYSDLCQHYFNLRASGLDRTAALATLARSSTGERKP